MAEPPHYTEIANSKLVANSQLVSGNQLMMRTHDSEIVTTGWLTTFMGEIKRDLITHTNEIAGGLRREMRELGSTVDNMVVETRQAAADSTQARKDAKDARSLAKEARDHVEAIQDELDEVLQERDDLRSTVKKYDYKLRDMENYTSRSNPIFEGVKEIKNETNLDIL